MIIQYPDKHSWENRLQNVYLIKVQHQNNRRFDLFAKL